MIVVVYDINIVLCYGDYVLMLKDGRLVVSGVLEMVIIVECLVDVYWV